MKHISFIKRAKKPLLIGVAAFVGSVCSLSAQTYPFSENSWNNPEFVDRFMGSYGALTEVQPSINSEEQEIFKQMVALMGQNQTDAAIEVVAAGIKPDSSAALEYTLGNLYLQKSDYESAFKYYKQAIKKFPDFLNAYKNLGLGYLQEGRFEEGLKCLVKAVDLGDREGNTYGLMGYCYLNMGQYQTALDAYRMAMVTDPNNKDWKLGKARSMMAVGLYREALGLFNELIEKDGGKSQYYISCANAHIALDELNQAAKYLELVCRMGEAKAETYQLLGDIYINQNLVDVAYGVYEKAMAKYDNLDAGKLIRFANALVQRSAYTRAEEFIQKTSKYLGDDISKEDKLNLYNLEAEVALATQQDDKAAGLLEKVIELDPMNGRAILQLARYYNDSKDDIETADFYFTRAENLKSVAVDAYVEHARAKVGQRNYGEALKLLENAQSRNYRKNVADYEEAVRKAYEASR